MTVKIDGPTGVDKVQPLSIEQEDLKWVPPFTKEYVSAEQVITAGGGLTLYHGLGTPPKLVKLFYVMKSTIGGYSINDVVSIDNIGYYAGGGATHGALSIGGSAEIIVRFGQCLLLLNKTNGAPIEPAFSDVRLVVRAWA